MGILGRQTSRDDPRVLGARMRGMILCSLLAVGFSVLPFILHRYGLREETVWRVASALFAVALATVGGWVALAIRRLTALGIPRRPIHNLIGVVIASGISTGTVLLLLNSLLIGPALLAAV